MANRLAQIRAERGWKKLRLIRELRTAAACRGITLPKDESLGRRIAAWENQGGVVGDLYRDLLCDVYQLSALELGLVEPPITPDSAPPMPELVERLTFGRLDAGLIELLRGQTQHLRLLDRRLGAATLLQQTSAHAEQIETLIRYALPDAHRAAAAVALGQAASLAGWQALDMGRLEQSWRLYETAKNGAREGGNPSVLAYVRAEQAYVLLDADRGGDALSLVRDARGSDDGALPPILRAWLNAAEGEVLAALGNRDAALDLLDAAAAVLPTECSDPDLPFLMLNAAHLARWRGHCLARLGEASAIESLATALDAMRGGQYARAEAGLRVDLAIALTARGDLTQARPHAERAADLVGLTGSQRQRRRIGQLLARAA